MSDPQLLQQLLEPLLPGRPVEIVAGLQDRHHVVLDRQLAEDGRLLRQIAQSQLGAAVHRQEGDVLPVEVDPARIAINEPHDHVERGRFAGTVRPEQANHFAVGDLERQVTHHLARLVALGQARGFQRAHGFFSGSILPFGVIVICTRPSVPGEVEP